MYQGALLQDVSVLSELKSEHLGSLSAPLDAYWEEAVIGFADHYELQIDGQRIGFYCINSDHQLIAFHLTEEHAAHSESAMRHVIVEHHIKAALSGSNDPLFHSLCLDVASKVQLHTLLFQDNQKLTPELNDFDELTFEVATDNDFDDVFKHYCATSGSMDTDSIETGFKNIEGYLRSVMDQHRIFVLREKGTLIATSECRISQTQKPYADIGMIVGNEYRRKGVGSYVLACTKAFCYQHNASPICSCEIDNIGSKKSIANAGFISRYRVALIEFE